MTEQARYIIDYREADRGNWSSDLMQHEIPNTKRQAAELLRELQEQMAASEFRVTFLDFETNTFADVTLSIETMAEELAADEEYQAAEDYSHIEQERHSWGQV